MLPEPFRAMDPDDEVGWHAVADWLEEHDSHERAELVRLTRLLRNVPRMPDHERHEDRLRELLAAGVEPCVATLTNSLGMEFVYVPAGVFLMGSPDDEEEREENEGPVHEVEITRGFYLGRSPVTQAEYESVMGKNPSGFSTQGDALVVLEMDARRFPVEKVSHEDALRFCETLSENTGGWNGTYRLPTEAEWEYSCRSGAGSKAPFHFGTSLSSTQANFDGNNPYGGAAEGPWLERTCEVNSYPANVFGLHDMHGNVFEWCADWYGASYYAGSPQQDPTGPVEGSDRVIRGGSWLNDGWLCRSAVRGFHSPSNRDWYIGFRVAWVPPGE
jgi:uncharacterized protein (TIGR02996 family)